MSATDILHWFILDGHEPKEVGFGEWCNWVQENEHEGSGPGKRSVARTWIDGFEVSTVFLLTVPGYRREESQFFETMLFYKGRPTGERCWRYKTWEEAEEGHRKACDRLRAELATRGGFPA